MGPRPRRDLSERGDRLTAFKRLREAVDDQFSRVPVELPEGAQLTWSRGLMAEVGTSPLGLSCRLSQWAAEPGTGTPLLWRENTAVTWAYFGAHHPFAISRDVLSSEWVERIFVEPSLARELTGVFSFFAIDARRGRAIIVGDRLGVQALHYGHDRHGTWRISTHAMWLMLANGHDGAVEPAGFLAHMGFGYPVAPHTEVYRGVCKMPPAGYITVGLDSLRQATYAAPVVPGETLQDELIPRLVFAVDSAMNSTLGSHQPLLGLTAGKDSLCLASIATRPMLTGTLGVPSCADQVQARHISNTLGWPHLVGTVCSPELLPAWASHVSFQSAGLATASYVDMAAFVDAYVPRGSAFVMGEGGECVRDFFQANGRPALTTLQQDYVTPVDYLRETLVPALLHELRDYPGALLASVRDGRGQEDDRLFATYFYRFQRMPGNFSLRHAVLGSLRARLSPFLDTRFMEHAYGLHPQEHTNSRVHRLMIAYSRPALLQFFERPARTPYSAQHWHERFADGMGPAVEQILVDALPYCDDVFAPHGIRDMCRRNIVKPSRAIYHLLRIVSFVLARRLLRAEAATQLGEIERQQVVLFSYSAPSVESGTAAVPAARSR
jgi:hypothetical protein